MAMKKGLMTQFPCARGRAFVCKNIGDYVQAVATRQFVNPIDEYIEQEEANMYYPEDKKPIKLIMNGWFQWRAENWPPTEYVKPLLVSMHISPIKANQLLTPEGIEFLKKNSPVGCRDYYTKSLLESVGVPSYFSACMTLTLGKKYAVDRENKEGICFVDPYFAIPDLYSEENGETYVDVKLIDVLANHYFKHKAVIDQLSQREFFKIYSPKGFLDRDDSPYRALYKAILFHKVYSKKFDDELLLKAEYITHWMDVDMSGCVTNDDLLDIAEGLVKKYASAKLIVTSRIHAGLPGLGVGTPVIFIANEEVIAETGTFNTPGRLGGLVDLFRVLLLENDTFVTDDIELLKYEKIDETVAFENKSEWIEYAHKLENIAEEFMKD